MMSDGTRLGNRALTLGIIVLGLATAVLAYALLSRSQSPRPSANRVYNPNGLLGDIIQVEVRNGCGVTGLASRMSGHLRSFGFDVVEFGDHTSFDVEKTRVIDRIGNMDAAKQVALALGMPNMNIEQEVRADYFLDVSVIIGRDYENLKPFKVYQ